MNAFVWDFDGTLFDTYPHTMDAIQEAVRRLGFEQDRGELYEWLMHSIPYAHEHVRAKFGFDGEKYENGLMYGRLIDELVGTDRTVQGGPFPYTVRVLEEVERRGGRNFMFTHRVHDVYEFLDLYGLRERFARIVTLADGVKAKPSPEAIELLVKEYDLDPARTVMIGDREIDVLSGSNAGVKTCHVFNRLPYTPFACDWRFAGLDELYDALVTTPASRL